MDFISLGVILGVISGVVVLVLWFRRPNRTTKTSLVGKIIGGGILLFIIWLLLVAFLIVFRPFGGI